MPLSFTKCGNNNKQLLPLSCIIISTVQCLCLSQFSDAQQQQQTAGRADPFLTIVYDSYTIGCLSYTIPGQTVYRADIVYIDCRKNSIRSYTIPTTFARSYTIVYYSILSYTKHALRQFSYAKDRGQYTILNGTETAQKTVRQYTIEYTIVYYRILYYHIKKT